MAKYIWSKSKHFILYDQMQGKGCIIYGGGLCTGSSQLWLLIKIDIVHNSSSGFRSLTRKLYWIKYFLSRFIPIKLVLQHRAKNQVLSCKMTIGAGILVGYCISIILAFRHCPWRAATYLLSLLWLYICYMLILPALLSSVSAIFIFACLWLMR